MRIFGRWVVSFAFDDGPPPGPGAVDAAIAYWEARGFRCARTGEAELVGQRGSRLGNLVAFDMRDVMCDLGVRAEAGRWSVRLLVHGTFQYLSAWSLAELALEAVMFRRELSRLPTAVPYLERYRAQSRRAAVLGSLTLTVLGRRLPKLWTQIIRELAAPHAPPAIERLGND